jgi:Methylase involved in ubiquinone/menaquinone biosynthesis
LEKNRFIFLPGSGFQVKKFLEGSSVEEKEILIIGSNSEELAKIFIENKAGSVIIVVDDNDSLLRSRFLLSGNKKISVRMMEFTNTDFKDSTFDIIYAQASISTIDRKKILKEIKRILKPDGIICTGEIVNLEKEVPLFIKNLRDNSGIQAPWINELNDIYVNAEFEIISEEDLSHRMQNFYRENSALLKDNRDDLTDQEKSYYKIILKKMSHESNAYLDLGGFKFMGFKMITGKKRPQ